MIAPQIFKKTFYSNPFLPHKRVPLRAFLAVCQKGKGVKTSPV
jgi:hypothetical protein